MTTIFGRNAKEDKEILDSWGKEGWELVSVVQTAIYGNNRRYW
jgi:hypothetical protein